MQSQFILDKDLIYINHAAVGPWPQCTCEAVTQFALENSRQGAKDYPRWVATESSLRELLRQLINAPSVDNIALLKNTSEALSVIAYGLEWQAGDNIVLAKQEFPSNRIIWESLSRLGVEVRIVDLSAHGDPEQALIQATDKHTRLLTVSSVQYATGLRMQLDVLGDFCKTHDILFCVDAIQNLGAFPFDVESCHADFVVADGHKWMLAPEGLALFYCATEWLEKLKLYQYGWHMVADAGNYDRIDWQPAATAKRFECGSPNMLGIHGLHASLKLLLNTGIASIGKQIHGHIEHLLELGKSVKNSRLISPSALQRCAGIMTLHIENRDNAALHRYLLKHNVICAFRGGGIRLSPHFYNTGGQLEQAIGILKQGISEADQ